RHSLPARLLLLNGPLPPFFSTLSLHDALPIFTYELFGNQEPATFAIPRTAINLPFIDDRLSALRTNTYRLSVSFSRSRFVRPIRSEEHTSELQSRENLVCRLLLEKKKKRQ